MVKTTSGINHPYKLMVDPIANILPQPPRPDYGHGRRGPRGRRGRRGHDFARTCA